jgi:hypothetical protein
LTFVLSGAVAGALFDGLVSQGDLLHAEAPADRHRQLPRRDPAVEIGRGQPMLYIRQLYSRMRQAVDRAFSESADCPVIAQQGETGR